MVDDAGNVGVSVVDVVTQVAITSSGGSFKNPPQVVSGTGEADSTVQLYDNGVKLGAALLVDETGTWSTSIRLAAGTNSLTVRDTPLAGEAVTSAAVLFMLDKQPPVVTLASSGGLTNQAAQTLSGTGEAGTSVQLYDGTRAVGSAVTVGIDGNWTAGLTISGQGTHSITARDTDAAGNVGTSDAVVFTYDSIAPKLAPPGKSAPGSAPNYAAGSGLGVNSLGGPTNQAVQTVAGVGVAGDRVQLFDNGTALGSAIAIGNSGTWSATFTLVGEGAHSIVARETDNAGNGVSAGPVVFTLDTLAPTNVAITTAAQATNVALLKLTGTGEAGTKLQLLDGGRTLGTAVKVDQSGVWSASVTLVGEGAHLLTARDTDAAGNVGTSNAVGFTLDTVAPTVAITSSGGLTKRTAPVVSGTGEAGTTVQLYDGAVATGASVVVGTTGHWTATAALATQGAHSITARATDAAGNVGTSVALGFTLDTVAPTVTLNPSGKLTNQAQQSFSGTGERLTSIELLDGGTVIGTATVNLQGRWSAAFVRLLPGDGTHVITARDTDDAGNMGISTATTFMLDAMGPVLGITSVGRATNQASQLVAGTIGLADAGATVTIFDSSTGRSLGTSVSLADGSWSATVKLVGEGSHALIARASDALGNAGASAAATWVLDFTGPSLAITSPGGLVNNASQSLSGTIGLGDAGVAVVLRDAAAGNAVVGSGVADGTGHWTAAVSLSGQGNHSLFAQASDSAGNLGASSPIGFTLDTVAPTVTLATAGRLTGQAMQNFSGTGERGTSVQVFDGATAIGSVNVNGQGRWSLSANLLPGEGAHLITARDTDTAGNVGVSAGTTFTLDLLPPPVAITTPSELVGTGQVVLSWGATGSLPTTTTYVPDIPGHDFTAAHLSDMLFIADTGILAVLEPARFGAGPSTIQDYYAVGVSPSDASMHFSWGGVAAGVTGGSKEAIDAVGDFDGDGRADLLVQAAGAGAAGQIGLITLTGNATSQLSGTYHALSNLAAPSNAVVVAVGNASNDGFQDVYWRLENGTGDVVLWAMHGTAAPVVTDLGNPGRDVAVQGVGDFQGNGVSSLLGRDSNGYTYLWQPGAIGADGQAGQASLTSLTQQIDMTWKIAGVGDFNGDHRADIVWTTPDPGDLSRSYVSIWLMHGAAVESGSGFVVIGHSLATTFAGAYSHLVGVGDYNADGKDDLLFQDNRNDLTFWMMDGITVSSISNIENKSTSNSGFFVDVSFQHMLDGWTLVNNLSAFG